MQVSYYKIMFNLRHTFNSLRILTRPQNCNLQIIKLQFLFSILTILIRFKLKHIYKIQMPCINERKHINIMPII